MSSYNPQTNTIDLSEDKQIYTLDNKKLIQVSSIREEKDYISQKYPNFELLQQKTIHVQKGKKIIPVDILTVKTKQGEKTFYFDVTSLFKIYNSIVSQNPTSNRSTTRTTSNYAKIQNFIFRDIPVSVFTAKEKETLTNIYILSLYNITALYILDKIPHLKQANEDMHGTMFKMAASPVVTNMIEQLKSSSNFSMADLVDDIGHFFLYRGSLSKILGNTVAPQEQVIETLLNSEFKEHFQKIFLRESYSILRQFNGALSQNTIDKCKKYFAIESKEEISDNAIDKFVYGIGKGVKNMRKTIKESKTIKQMSRPIVNFYQTDIGFILLWILWIVIIMAIISALMD